MIHMEVVVAAVTEAVVADIVAVPKVTAVVAGAVEVTAVVAEAATTAVATVEEVVVVEGEGEAAALVVMTTTAATTRGHPNDLVTRIATITTTKVVVAEEAVATMATADGNRGSLTSSCVNVV